MYFYGPPHMAKQKQDDQLEHAYSRCERIWDVAQKTCQRWWMIGRSCKRRSGISVLMARHDEGDEIELIQNYSKAFIRHIRRVGKNNRLLFQSIEFKSGLTLAYIKYLINTRDLLSSLSWKDLHERMLEIFLWSVAQYPFIHIYPCVSIYLWVWVYSYKLTLCLSNCF